MTTSIWTGPGGTGGRPRSGDFGDAGNWLGGAAPADGADVAFAAGRYTVDVDRGGYTLGALTVGAGVTLVSRDTGSTYGYLVLTEDSTSYGALSFLSSTIAIASGATLYNFGEIYGRSEVALANTQGAGTLENLGVIHSAAASAFELDSLTLNDAGGVIDTRGGGQLVISGTLTNHGLVSAVDGGYLNFAYGAQTGSTTNLNDLTLSGGQWSAIGASILEFRGNGGVAVIAADTDVTLSGAGSIIRTDNGDGTLTSLEAKLGRVDDGGALHILGGRDYATALDLDVDGLLQLGGGTLTAHSMIVHDDPTSALVGFGVVDTDIEMYGVLRADRNKGGEALTLTGQNTIYDGGSLVGRGVLEIAEGVSVVQEGAQVLVKTLLVSGGELDLNQNLTYGGKLRVTGDGHVTLGGDILRVTGELQQVNGVIANGSLQIETTQVVVQGQHAEWDVDVRNNGEVDFGSGTLVVDGAVNGNGAFFVSGGSTLEFGGAVGAGQYVDLVRSGGKLVFDHAQTFKASVAEFDAGDRLDLASFAFAGATLGWKNDSSGSGGTLTVTSGGDVATIHLTGAHARIGFQLVDDGSGHAAVTYGESGAAAHGDLVV